MRNARIFHNAWKSCVYCLHFLKSCIKKGELRHYLSLLNLVHKEALLQIYHEFSKLCMRGRTVGWISNGLMGRGRRWRVIEEISGKVECFARWSEVSGRCISASPSKKDAMENRGVGMWIEGRLKMVDLVVEGCVWVEGGAEGLWYE